MQPFRKRSRTLCASRVEEASVRADVLDMRRRMAAEISVRSPWDIKHQRGGLVDVEFIAQYLQILHARNHPDIMRTNTLAALSALARHGLLAPSDAQALERACRLYQRLTQLLRLTVSGRFEPAEAVPGLCQLLSSAAEVPDISRAESLLADTQGEVLKMFEKIVGRSMKRAVKASIADPRFAGSHLPSLLPLDSVQPIATREGT